MDARQRKEKEGELNLRERGRVGGMGVHLRAKGGEEGSAAVRPSGEGAAYRLVDELG